MHKRFLAQAGLVMLLGVGMLALSACGRRAVPPAVPTLAQFPGTPTAQCAWEEMLPKIEAVKPDEIRPGTEVAVSARGGYLRDTCGGVNESARTYPMYFDDEPVGDLMCYVNQCEGKFTVAASVAPGRHCMGVQKGSCQVEVDVVGE